MGDGRVRGDVCAVSESGVWLCVRCERDRKMERCCTWFFCRGCVRRPAVLKRKRRVGARASVCGGRSEVHRCSRRQAETVLKIAGFRMLVTHLRRLTTRTTLPSGRLK